MSEGELSLKNNVKAIGKNYSIETFECLYKNKPVNFRFVEYVDPSNNYTIIKQVIEKEYLVSKTLLGKSVCSLESPLIYTLDNKSLILGFCTERLFINLDNEIKIKKVGKSIYTQDEIKKMLYSLVDTLADAEMKNIYHGPFTLKNLVRNIKYDLIVIGWGQEFHIDFEEKNRRPLESFYPEYEKYMCPSINELDRFYENYFDEKIYKKDVFSLGLIFYRLIFERNMNITCEMEFDYNFSQMINDERIKNNYPDIINILKRMLIYNIDKRINFIELRKQLLDLKFDKIQISDNDRENTIKFIKDNSKKAKINLMD